MPKGVYDHSNRPNKKEEILRAAMKVYAFYGFEGATIERMAASAGVSKALVLKHFGSKQEMVREMAGTAVQDNLEKIGQINAIPGITLREREEGIFSIIKPAREEWCLILGTLLVPNFQFHMRNKIEGYIDAEYKAVLTHMDELLEPTKETAYAFAYSMASLRMAYIVDGREPQYRRTAAVQFRVYLRPEERLLEENVDEGTGM